MIRYFRDLAGCLIICFCSSDGGGGGGAVIQLIVIDVIGLAIFPMILSHWDRDFNRR